MPSPRQAVPPFPATSSAAEAQSLHWVTRNDLPGYEKMARRIHSLIGVAMPATEKNRTLMACRLAPVLRDRQLRSYADYDRLLEKGSSADIREFISALTTNTTSFFREARHFDLVPSVVQQLATLRNETSRPDLRVWCAAASTGQEPYSLLFSLLATPGFSHRWNLKFLASDVDRTPLLAAKAGRYTGDECAKVPEAVKRRFFDPIEGGFGVKAPYRKMITFAEFNLALQRFPFRFGFDIVFCRNVLIYFDHEQGARVVERIAEVLKPGAFLFVGHSETGFVRSRQLRSIASAVYQKT